LVEEGKVPEAYATSELWFGNFVPGKPMNFPSFVLVSSPKIPYQLLEFITETCREFKDTHGISREALEDRFDKNLFCPT
jgi:hypothetical protein